MYDGSIKKSGNIIDKSPWSYTLSQHSKTKVS